MNIFMCSMKINVRDLCITQMTLIRCSENTFSYENQVHTMFEPTQRRLTYLYRRIENIFWAVFFTQTEKSENPDATKELSVKVKGTRRKPF